MPSPFPGMDPYLEDRALWPDLHQRLIAYSAEALQAQIRPNYVARIGERVELAGVDRSVIPDVMVVRPPQQQAIEQQAIETVAGALIADEPVTITGMDEERRIPFIEIMDRASREVITLIEVLSPANKTGAGRDQYLQKQADLVSSSVNLVEIDLLGYGRPTVLARNVARSAADWRYIVSVSRSEERNRLEIYPILLDQRLPRCRIPLRTPDPDAVLDLPAVFTRCYDVGGYDLLIDYSQPPETIVNETEAQWMAARLQSEGSRHRR